MPPVRTGERLVLLRRLPEEDPGVDTFRALRDLPDAEAALRRAVKAYLQTPAGKARASLLRGCFNWGDAIEWIPAHHWRRYGIEPTTEDLVAIDVDNDETLHETE